MDGRNITTTVEGRERYPVPVRHARAFRDNPDRLDRVLVRPPAGFQVPLTLAITALLLYFNFGSLVEIGIVMLSLPFALVGGLW